tara:strand:- start:56 stop:376 length:321 start_codon:yes stop_codon:yes gene_type:complete
MALTLYTLPLKNIPQRFEINIAGNDLVLVSTWDYLNTTWYLTIIEQSTQTILVNNTPLVTGINLLVQYKYLGFNFSLVVVSEGDFFALPTQDNLGSTCNVLIGVDQ